MTGSPPEVERLLQLLRERHGADVTVVGAAESNTEGFDSAIHFVELGGASLPDDWRGPLVLRVKSDADRLDEARREAAIHQWLVDRGYPAPRMLEVFAPGELGDRPVQVVERMAGVSMLDELRARPWRVRPLMVRLADLQVGLHRLPVDGFPPGDDLLDRRLQLTRSVVGRLGEPRLRAALERVEARADELRAAPATVCHGDFHPLNVLVEGRSASVIDWTDAGLGDRHGDIARTVVLFEVAAIAASNSAERLALRAVGPLVGRRYLRSYRRRLAVDPLRLQRWVPVHLLHSWAQLLSMRAGGDERVPQSLVDEIDRRFHAALP